MDGKTCIIQKLKMYSAEIVTDGEENVKNEVKC